MTSTATQDTSHVPPLDRLTRAALATCVRAGVAAPSIHNSQPWRFRINDGGIDVLADWSRRLAVIDPAGRELLISVGAALFNVRLAIREQGRVPAVQLFGDPSEPAVVARVTPGTAAPPGVPLSALASAIPRRHTNRRPFEPTVIPASVLEDLIAAAGLEGATLRIADAVGRGAILSLVRTAERRLHSEGAYRAELTEWTRPARGRHDGVPPRAFAPWDTRQGLPLRDFGLTEPPPKRRGEQFEAYPTIVVLSTEGDTQEHWLRAGQALQRVLLTATLHDLAATPLTQPLEIPQLRTLLSNVAAGRWAQVILRIGYGQPTTRTLRRRLADVLVEMP